MWRTALSLPVAVVITVLAAAPSLAQQRTTLPDVEDEVMCTTCNVPLNVAEGSPQAQRQRALIRDLVVQGRTKAQIKAVLVDEYGEGVLALPPDEGFGLAAYVVPLGAFAGVGLALALALPRWRRRARTGPRAGSEDQAVVLSRADARRLDDDLARYRL
ncbi:MAG TPA: cytochrome c-type biogenesis protein CcmH [Solirubrobacteraceae bacterium]|nr:cytochrome c-type biogenesis protein CcmH [Solirubrobacteraceae bacterium]